MGGPEHFVFSAFLSYTVDNIPGLNLANLANLRLNLASLGIRSLYWLARGFWGGFLHGLGGVGGGVGLAAEVRGYLEGVSTRYLHSGGTHFLDGTPLPARIQLLMNFSVFDAPAWNRTMDRFRMKDMLEAVGKGKLDMATACQLDSVFKAKVEAARAKVE